MSNLVPAAAIGLPSSDAILIAPRRNFLIRALGFTAGGAAMSIPVLAVEGPEARLKHHIAGTAKALQELFPGQYVDIKGNCLNGAHTYYQEKFARGEQNWACVILTAGPRTDGGGCT